MAVKHLVLPPETDLGYTDIADDWDAFVKRVKKRTDILVHCTCPRDGDCGSMCDSRTTQVECTNTTCERPACTNRGFAQAIKNRGRLHAFDAGPKGRGLTCSEDLKAGEVILPYMGELMKQKKVDKLVAAHRPKHRYTMKFAAGSVEATWKGAICRFANHSCDPNCYFDQWNVGYSPCIALVAIDAIPAWTELTVQYNGDPAHEPQTCLCGSAICTGWIWGVPPTTPVRPPTPVAESSGSDSDSSSSSDSSAEPKKLLKRKAATNRQSGKELLPFQEYHLPPNYPPLPPYQAYPNPLSSLTPMPAKPLPSILGTPSPLSYTPKGGNLKEEGPRYYL